MNRDIELAWAAGFYDGEGSVWWRPPSRTGERPARGGRGQLRVTIQQNDPAPLERFRGAVRVGTVVGPYVRQRPGRQANNPFWSYQAHKAGEVVAIAGFLWAFLCEPKRAQLHAAMRSWQAG